MKHDPWKFDREAAVLHPCGIKFLKVTLSDGFHLKAWFTRSRKPFFMYRFSTEQKRQLWIEGCITRMKEANVSKGLNECGLFYLGRKRKIFRRKNLIDLIGRVV